MKSSPFRAAYALDDEISWGHFVHPCMWRVTDDRARLSGMAEGDLRPERPRSANGWITYNDIRPKLKTWTVADFDASQLMDQWTFNDSYWNNFLGDLVEYANSSTRDTPCGFVGGQAPNAFGGYDYAKLMRKVQFIEAYNIGSSQAIIRSFNPHNAMPTVTTHFHKAVDDTVWQIWYYLAHGNRGFIGWVENWFDGDKRRSPGTTQVAPHLPRGRPEDRPADDRAPSGSTTAWPLYYSHASIQLGWILDAEAHGKTWINRNGDDTPRRLAPGPPRLGEHAARRGTPVQLPQLRRRDPERRIPPNTRC